MSKSIHQARKAGIPDLAIVLLAAAALGAATTLAQESGMTGTPPPGQEQDTPQEQAPAAEATGAEQAASEATPETSEGAGDAGEDAEAAADADPADADDSDLDDQTYESEDEGFIPTEEIPADEPIPFPSDI